MPGMLIQWSFQVECSHVWSSNASLGNTVYALFPFSGLRLRDWRWGKHKVMLSVQFSSSTGGLQGSDEHIHSADQFCRHSIKQVFYPLLVGYSFLSFFPFCFSSSCYSVSLKWACVKPAFPNNYLDCCKSMDWITSLKSKVAVPGLGGIFPVWWCDLEFNLLRKTNRYKGIGLIPIYAFSTKFFYKLSGFIGFGWQYQCLYSQI